MAGKGIRTWVGGGLAFIGLFAFGPGSLRAETPMDGKALYQRECAVCHGPQGKGDGPASEYVFPKPRDLTRGVFKIRSTSSGEPPTDQDLFQTLTRGMPGSAMPSFGDLTPEERWNLVRYLRGLSGGEKKPEQIIEVPRPPAPSPKTLALGRAAYEKLGCGECHGALGRGDGPSALTLKDDRGYPAPPNDFTRGIFKGGGKEEDVYLRFTTGMDGSPMPSFEDSTSEEERWALVHYVKSLSGAKVAAQPEAGLLVAKRLKGPLPLAPTDPAWQEVAPFQIPLILLWQRQEAAQVVSVRAAHNGEEIIFLLEWEDGDASMRTLRHQDYSDAAALQFSLGAERPLFAMGEKGKPVNIWQWRADWQMDLAQYQDLEDFYPHLVADDYQSEVGHPARGSQRPVPRAPGHDPTYITGWGAKNPLSEPWRTSAVEVFNAEGFGTLTSRGEGEEKVLGRGLWAQGSWRVVFSRRTKSPGPFDVQFEPGTERAIAFAVWDGGKGDVDGKKAVTTWYRLRLEK